RAVGGGHARVDGGVEQDLADLFIAESVAPGGADVHGQLVLLAQRGEDRQRDRAAGAAVEAIAGPDAAPCLLGDELLERRGELGGPLHGAVDVLVAEHLAADPHAALVGVVFGHAASRWSMIRLVTASGCCTLAMC